MVAAVMVGAVFSAFPDRELENNRTGLVRWNTPEVGPRARTAAHNLPFEALSAQRDSRDLPWIGLEKGRTASMAPGNAMSSAGNECCPH